MVKIAILEYEKETKDIIFYLGQLFKDIDWTFRHFYKASELAKAAREENYQIFIFDEIFKTPRVESVFVHDNPSAMIIYVCHDPAEFLHGESQQRIHYISRTGLVHDLEMMRESLLRQVRQREVYSLVYHGVKIDLPVEDIYYLEKNEKNVYFHTKKGEFHRRLNLSDLEQAFEPYGFLRVHNSFLINPNYMTGVMKDEVELCHSIHIPLSRAQKKKLGLRVRKGRSSENSDE